MAYGVVSYVKMFVKATKFLNETKCSVVILVSFKTNLISLNSYNMDLFDLII